MRQQVWAGRSRPVKLDRTESPCDYLVSGQAKEGEVRVFLDLASDERCRSMAVRTGFYAGVAIKYSIGGGAAQRVGTLCVYDAQPQESFSEEDCKKLLEFGDRVSSVLSSPLGSHLDRSNSDGHRLQSVGERVQALMVRWHVWSVDP